MFPKYTNDVYMIKCKTILKIYSQNISVAFAKATIPNIVDNGGAFRALMTDLLKTFYCLSYGILIAKLVAFGLDKMSLKLVHNYLSNRKQSVKINDSYSSWTEIL